MWLINPKEISLNKLTNDVIDRYMGQYEKGWNDCIDSILEDIQRIEAEPVRHGRWIRIDDTYAKWKCSECGAIEDHSGWPYCHCGAKMDAKEEDT